MVIPDGYELLEDGEFFVRLQAKSAPCIGSIDLLMRQGFQFVQSEFSDLSFWRTNFVWDIVCMKIQAPCGS